MQDLIKRLNEVGEESPVFEALMLKLEIAINSDSVLDELEKESEYDALWEN
jgi:hypothetical protein